MIPARVHLLACIRVRHSEAEAGEKAQMPPHQEVLGSLPMSGSIVHSGSSIIAAAIEAAGNSFRTKQFPTIDTSRSLIITNVPRTSLHRY